MRITLVSLIFILIWLVACTAKSNATQPPSSTAPTLSVTMMSDSAIGLTPTIDATATAAALIIAQALLVTPVTGTPISGIGEARQTAPTVDLAATQTAEAQRVATAVAATLTAQPTATPDLGATRTVEAQQIATSVIATLLALPTTTSTPTPTWTPKTSSRIKNFAACLEPCQGDRANARRVFPERITKVYLTWVFSDFPVGARYMRVWSLAGKGEWARYECTWPGPESGVENLTLSVPKGLHSGVWEVTITVDQEVVLREQLVVEGNWELWDPPGIFTSCYGKR